MNVLERLVVKSFERPQGREIIDLGASRLSVCLFGLAQVTLCFEVKVKGLKLRSMFGSAHREPQRH